MLSRRNFLQASSLALGASSLAPLSALAADQSGYKALVCVFLNGGVDCHDILIGHDQASYDQWASSRQTIINQFAAAGNAGAPIDAAVPRIDGGNLHSEHRSQPGARHSGDRVAEFTDCPALSLAFGLIGPGREARRGLRSGKRRGFHWDFAMKSGAENASFSAFGRVQTSKTST